MKNRLHSDSDKEGAILELHHRLASVEEALEELLADPGQPYLSAAKAKERLKRSERYRIKSS